MAHEVFRQSPVYQRALQAHDTMCIPPADPTNRRLNYDAERLARAMLRLDHLIKKALDLDEYGFLRASCISAMKAFLRFIDQTLPSMRNAPANIVALLRERMTFCRELIAASDKELLATNYWQIASAEWFEDKVARFHYTMHDMVYANPFSYLYSSQDGRALYYGGSMNQNLNDSHRFFKVFWD